MRFDLADREVGQRLEAEGLILEATIRNAPMATDAMAIVNRAGINYCMEFNLMPISRLPMSALSALNFHLLTNNI